MPEVGLTVRKIMPHEKYMLLSSKYDTPHIPHWWIKVKEDTDMWKMQISERLFDCYNSNKFVNFTFSP